MEMPAHRFMPMAVFAGVLWGEAVVALGYVPGSNWRLVERWMRSLGAGTLILLGLTILTVLLWRWLAGRQNEITAAWQRRAGLQRRSARDSRRSERTEDRRCADYPQACRSFVHKKTDYGQKAVVSDFLGSSNKIFSTLSTRSPGPEWQVRAASWRAL